MNERTNKYITKCFIKKLGFRGVYTEMTLSTSAHSITYRPEKKRQFFSSFGWNDFRSVDCV